MASDPGTPSPLAPDEILLVVSVDTEEDNWAPARAGITVENARHLPRVQARFEQLGVRPTYFVTHALAKDPMARDIVAALHEGGRAEIGAHLHPWNTPPLDEPFEPRNTMLLNLPPGLQRAKLDVLTSSLRDVRGGGSPTSFRAGRWGLGSEMVGALLDCGYAVDSSVTPYTSWAGHDDGPSHIGAPPQAYHLDRGGDVRRPGTGPLVELPPSFGFSRGPLERSSRIHRAIMSPLVRWTRLPSVAYRLDMVRYVTLSPETDGVDNMLALTRALLADGVRHLHLYFHSPTLTPGLTPFTRAPGDVDRFLGAIDQYVERTSALARLRFATVSDAARLLVSARALARS